MIETNLNIRERGEHYKLLFDSINSGVAIYKPVNGGRDFIFVDFNKTAERIDSQKKEELIGKSIFETRPGAKKFGLIDAFREVIITGKAIYRPIKFYKDDKLQGWYDNYIYRLPSGEIVTIFNNHPGIRKEENDIQASGERFHRIFEMATEMICIVNINTAELIDVNPAFTRVMGYTEQELKGKLLLDLIHQDDLGQTKYVIDNELKKSGKAVCIENRCRCKNGLYRSFDWNLQPDIDKGLLYITIRDISAIRGYKRNSEGTNRQMKKKKKPGESEDQILDTIFDNVPAVMIQLDEDTNVIRVNKSGLKFASKNEGGIESSLLGNVLNCIGTINNSDGCGRSELCRYCVIRKTIKETLITGKPSQNAEVDLISYNNSIPTIFTLLVSTSILKRGNIKNVLVTIIDISDKRRLEKEYRKTKDKADESNKLKSAFLANISHEIRTPLNGIIGFTDLLTKHKEISSDQKEKYSTIIKNCSYNLLNIVNNIIDISLIESGIMEINRNPFYLNDLFDELNLLYIKKISLVNKKIELCVVKEDKIIINNDENKVRQIFANLLDNAIKFTDKGTIRFGIYKIDRNIITLFVEDTGIGISGDKHSVIFNSFRQGNDEINRNYGGIGLGLSIVKGLVKLIGGSVQLDSDPGKGSVFWLRLPYNKTEAEIFYPTIKEKSVEKIKQT